MKDTDKLAGKGDWRKRMLLCNEGDTGLNVTWHESEQTSNWSFIAVVY